MEINTTPQFLISFLPPQNSSFVLRISRGSFCSSYFIQEGLKSPCRLGSGCPIIYHPDVVTVAYADFSKKRLKHIFSMIDTGRELVECFHDGLLSLSEIFSTGLVFVSSVVITEFQCASIQCVRNFSCFAELVCIVLSNGMKCQ